MSQDPSVDELCDRGYLALQEERWEDALAVAAELRSRRFSATFEIEARARAGQGDLDAAIKVLEEGVTEAPQSSSLWHWLGCYCSDASRYEQALEAFAHELECPEAPTGANSYNVALVYARMGRPVDALAVLDRTEMAEADGPPAVAFRALRADLLVDLGQPEEAEALATQCILDADDSDEETNDPATAMPAPAYVARGRARLALGRRDEAMEDALQAFFTASEAQRGMALQLLREVDDVRLPAARWLTIQVHGEVDVDKGRLPFYASAEVVAPDPESALPYISRLLPDDSAESLQVEEWEDHGPADDELNGVVSFSDLYCYDPTLPDDEDDPADQ